MTERKKALLEAALLCSQYADNLNEDHPACGTVAYICAKMIQELADSDEHFYPPGKPVNKETTP